jgi:hypothetical protein
VITIHSISGYDEVTDAFLMLAKQFREKPDRKGAYTDVMKAVTPRILKQEKIHMDEKDLPF